MIRFRRISLGKGLTEEAAPTEPEGGADDFGESPEPVQEQGVAAAASGVNPSALLRSAASWVRERKNGSREARPGHIVRRDKALGIGLAAVILASAVSWVAASRIRSPAEIAARTAAPKASLISVPVEKRTLSSDVVVRGTVRYGAPQQVSLPVSALKKANGILTTAPVKGKELAEGNVAFTVSGRPVFVLQGAQPAYRDMGPGAQGEDIRQLEQALVRLGYNPGAADGAYDGRTASAVAALYLASGSAPLGPTEEQIQLLRAEQADSIAVQSEVLAAQEALAAAQRDLALAEQRAGIRPLVPGAPLPPAASAADAAARARAEQQRVQAVLAVSRAKRTLDQAIENERQAQARMEEARSRQPPPSSEEYSALARESRQASDRVAMARDELAAAQEAAASLGVAPDASGPTPADAAQVARDAATAARDAKLEQATAQADVDKANNAVNFARRRVALVSGRAQYSLTAGKLGIQVPADEVLFFPGLPLRVDEVKLKPGDETLGPVMTVTNSRLVIESALTLTDSKLVREGATVEIRAADVGIDAKGTVTRVATTPGTNGVDPQRFYLEVTPDDITATLLGASVVQTISVESTGGEVLAVPVGALSETADGRTRVQVQGAAGKTRWVVVTPGLAAKGLVAVTPVSGALERGDLVVVGSSGSSRAKGAKDQAKTSSKGSRG